MFLNVFWRRFWCKFNAIFLVYVRFGRRFGTRHRPTYSATLRVLIHGFESRPTGWEPQIRKAEPALSLGQMTHSTATQLRAANVAKTVSAILIGWVQCE